MVANQWVMLLAFVYIGVLFVIAWWSDRHVSSNRLIQSLIYSLSLAVYCTSWTFFGAVGQAVTSGWSFLPIYIGPILLFLFGRGFLRRLSVVCSRNRVTSIADFLGARFGKNQMLAALVTLVAVVGSLPYIALQLKAVTKGWITIEKLWQPQTSLTDSAGETSFITALLLVLFTVAFGTRVVDRRHRHRGLMTAIAVESLVKLCAFLVVGLFSLFMLFKGFGPASDTQIVLGNFDRTPEMGGFITQTLLAMAAIVCLPRQFHVMVVEHHSRRDMRTASWLFPLYLLLFSMMIAPIAVLGQSLMGFERSAADMFVVSIPIELGNETLAVIALLGGLSAATGMVIVACVTLSIMVCNEWIVPIRQALQKSYVVNVRWLQKVRRIAIAAILLAAWLLEQQLSGGGGLASLGLLSFAAAAQLLPAILAALYWPRAHFVGVVAGIAGGGVIWFFCLLVPAMLGQSHPLVAEGLFGNAFLRPEHLFGLSFESSLTHGVFWSLLVNTGLMIFLSRGRRFTALDLRQARVFTDIHRLPARRELELEQSPVESWQLQQILVPMLGHERYQSMWREFEKRLGHRLLDKDRVPRFVLKETEEALSSIVGAVSAHRTLELLQHRKPLKLDDFVELIGNSSRQIQFGQDLLQVTLETIPQGISVVDANLNLVAWNQRYVELFNFPERLLYVGCPISRVYQYNAERGYLQGAQGDVDGAVQRRLTLLRNGQPYRLERRLPNDRVIEICGIPIESGGYVTTYTDISEYRRLFGELEQARDQLETRVVERTSELEEANRSLAHENQARARIERELNTVYASKNRFLASASHDLLQPINAARLFTASLASKVEQLPLNTDVKHIDEALAGAEDLITSLREIARLDSGRMQVNAEAFPLQELLVPLGREFAVVAERSGLSWRMAPCSLWVHTDKNLLRRVIQNLVGNALRYTQKGGVLLGCRRVAGGVRLEIWDTGAGIAEQDQERIFEEFERASDGPRRGGEAGLGLGLSIVQRISRLLGLNLQLRSTPGKGTVFSVTLPVVASVAVTTRPVLQDSLQSDLAGLRVLCIDNEPAIRAGMQSLLSQWNCTVHVAASLREALAQWTLESPPDIVLADYHLDAGETGLDVLQALSYHWGQPLQAVVISADNSDDMRQRVVNAGYRFLSKPVKPAVLRAVMRNIMAIPASPPKPQP
ncbi:PAS domain-containing hybrid sensor histidine kinase/response regulator [Spongiibacter sp. KMU-158]|uniref:histidine kinase n=1 Tax=Spongiibacter pelagi TaxID=2760804 RepID=A0A927C325_9GAMM|nr:PAS-domain containing protein [Spongiibacter pelagi]MBD2858927.1 PAS domain-containing hybrid sensor histidine kinase/response regulator [Spongiibacter pelagi]